LSDSKATGELNLSHKVHETRKVIFFVSFGMSRGMRVLCGLCGKLQLIIESKLLIIKLKKVYEKICLYFGGHAVNGWQL
jgi:hypothetical protein